MKKFNVVVLAVVVGLVVAAAAVKFLHEAGVVAFV